MSTARWAWGNASAALPWRTRALARRRLSSAINSWRAHLFGQGQSLAGQSLGTRPVFPVQRQPGQIARVDGHALGVTDRAGSSSAMRLECVELVADEGVAGGGLGGVEGYGDLGSEESQANCFCALTATSRLKHPAGKGILGDRAGGGLRSYDHCESICSLSCRMPNHYPPCLHSSHHLALGP